MDIFSSRSEQEYIGIWDLTSLVYAIFGAILFGALAYLSIDLTRGDDRIAAVWLPNAFAVAFLLRVRVPREDVFLVGLWIGNFLANTMIGDTPFRAASLSAANSTEIMVTLYLIRRFSSPQPDMQNVRDLASFVLFAGLCAPAVSATIAFTALSMQSPAAFHIWLEWVITDGLGMIIAVPATLIIADAISRSRKPTQAEFLEWLALTILGTALTVYVFSQNAYPFLFMVAPVVLIHTFRLGSLGTAICIVKVAIIATTFSWIGRGPIQLIDGSLTEQLITLQLFLATSFFIGLPVAAILHGRQQLTREIASSQQVLNTLAHSITDAVMRFDKDGICIYASPSVVDVLGKPQEFYVGRPASQKTHTDAQERVAEVERKLVSGESLKERFTYRRLEDDADGEPVFIEADCAVTFNRDTGERDGIIVSSRDVSERIRLESDLIRARRHAEQAARAKTEFLANMSHEIRTPMNGVLGFAELLLQSDLKADQRRQMEIIHESGRTMMLLLNDILDLSKIEAGHIVINPEPVDIHSLLKACTMLHTAHAERKGIALEYRESHTLHRNIVCDQLRLRQIVINLIGNAVKFTERGRVEVSTQLSDGSIAVRVSDTGIGIPEDRKEQIFAPFQQAESKTSRRFGGTGLGLTISRQLAALLGGTLTCSSTPGEGSSFTLTIPLKLAGAPEAPALADCGAAGPEAVLEPARILLAEDHDINRLLATAMLERLGQDVTIACDGDEAIAKVRSADAAGVPFDLVLMDIQMPHRDGYSATRALRGMGFGPTDVPIIALTANAFPEDVAAARDAGMQGHLPKPLVFAELMGILHRWLPSKIVEEEPLKASLQATTSPNETSTESSPPSADGEAIVAAPNIQSRWMERRREAVLAVEAAIKRDALKGDSGQNLARVVHKLAGTAGVFGEAELGAKATALERALKSDQPEDVTRQLAVELLDTAEQLAA